MCFGFKHDQGQRSDSLAALFFLRPSTATSLWPLSELDRHKEQSSMAGLDPSALTGLKVWASSTSWVPLPLAIHTWITSYNCRQHVGVTVTVAVRSLCWCH